MASEGKDDLITNGNHFMFKSFLKGKTTDDKTKELLSMMKLALTKANIDSQSNVIEMLKENKSRLE